MLNNEKYPNLILDPEEEKALKLAISELLKLEWYGENLIKKLSKTLIDYERNIWGEKNIEHLQDFLNINSFTTNTIVYVNLIWIVSIAKQYTSKSRSLSNLIKFAIITWIEATETFEHNQDSKFSTYANLLIRQKLIALICE